MNATTKLTAILMLLGGLACGGDSGRTLIPGDKVTFTADGVSFKMAFVSGKTFPTGMDDSGTATVVKDYWIGETEVTYELWSAVMTWATTGTDGTGAGQYAFADAGTMGDGTGDTNQHPVTSVSWRDSMVFCNALTEWYNAKNNKNHTCVYRNSVTPIRDSRDTNGAICDAVTPDASATGFRLLTSDEWELAARWRNDATNTVDGHSHPWFTKGNSASGATRAFDDLTTDTGGFAIYSANSGSSTAAVKSKTDGANALGLYDMNGNVWERCFTANGSTRLRRGGAWYNDADNMQIGSRGDDSPDYQDVGMGLRVARTQ